MAAPLAVSTVSASIAAGFILARIAGRQGREAARDHDPSFERLTVGFLDGTARGRDLLHAAARLEADLFWEAVDARMTRLKRRARLDLEQALARSRHVGTELRRL